MQYAGLSGISTLFFQRLVYTVLASILHYLTICTMLLVTLAICINNSITEALANRYICSKTQCGKTIEY